MKKFFAVVFIICLALSLIGCGSKPDTDPVVPDSVDVSQTPEETVAPKPFSEDDTIEDEAWDELEALGQVQTEDGVFFVIITLVVFLFLTSLLIIMHIKKNDDINYHFSINLSHILQIKFGCKSTKKKR